MKNIVGVGFFLLVLVGFGVGFYIDTNTNIIEEDVASYNIQNRYECYQIKDNQEYNNCLRYYLQHDPYELDEKLVATRLVK